MAKLLVNPNEGPIGTGTFGNIQIYIDSYGRAIIRTKSIYIKKGNKKKLINK